MTGSQYVPLFLQNRVIVGLLEGTQRVLAGSIANGIVLTAIVIGAIHYIKGISLAEDVATFCPTAVHLLVGSTATFPLSLSIIQLLGRA